MFHNHVLTIPLKLAVCLALNTSCEINNIEGLMFLECRTFSIVRKFSFAAVSTLQGAILIFAVLCTTC
mgnify:CR=1 FL=1